MATHEERPGYVRAGNYWVPKEPLNFPEPTLREEIVAYIRKRAWEYQLSSPQTCSNMLSLAREIEGDPSVAQHMDHDDDGGG